MERELKLRIPAEDLEKLRRAPLLVQPKGAVEPPKLLTSTYFDTPELAFHWCKASLRVRAVGNERVQTLKLEGSVQAGLFDRDEFEMPVDSDMPDLKLLQDQIPADTDCGRLIRDWATAARLKPVFVTRINRSSIPLCLPSGDELEVRSTRGPSTRTPARCRSRRWNWS
jgi:inorganic triphosphatase YgiF